MKKISTPLIFLILILLSTSNYCQNTAKEPTDFLPKIIPASPTAFALGNYGNTPVGLFTGSQNINIPVYTYRTTNLEVPINLLYTSNGVKVDEISSNVGQSWNLNFGGVITRTVRDEPDEIRETSPLPLNIYTASDWLAPEALEYYHTLGESVVDSESDLFSFNFGNYSGKFVYDNRNEIMLMPAQPIKIERVQSEDFYDFIATTPDGVRYYFSDKESTMQRTSGGGHSTPSICYSSWYLSKIVHPKGDEIYFTYVNNGPTYVASKSQTLKVLYPKVQLDYAGNMKNLLAVPSAIYENRLTISGKSIKSISSNNSFFGHITFDYDINSSPDVISGNNKITQINVFDSSIAFQELSSAVDDKNFIEKINFTYQVTPKKRIFLTEINYKDPNKKFVFDYIDKDAVPERLSFSQDHWGYYNGTNNLNIVPKNIEDYDLNLINYNGANKELNTDFAKIGLLSKIIYPTKGYTVFDYESNTYLGLKVITPNKVYQSLFVSNESEQYATKTVRKTIITVR